MIPTTAVDPEKTIARLRRYARPLAPILTGQNARLRRLPAIRAVLFDVYGTLFISASGDIGGSNEKERSQALGGALDALGIHINPTKAQQAAAVLVKTIGEAHALLEESGRAYPEVDIREIFLKVLRSLRKEGLISKQPDRELCEALSVEYECRINPTWPMPGLVETLQRLKERETNLGIVSNAQFFTPLLFPAHLDKPLETLGFAPDLCAWSYIHLEAKPSANLFQHALKALQRRNIAPLQALYVGNDRINDIWPAARAGLKTALFAGDRRSFRPRREDPRGRGVREDVLLTAIPQLLEVVDLP